MKIKMKRFDKSLPLPEYKTKGAAAFDLHARIDITIAPKSIDYIPLNVAVEVPPGYFGLLAARSSTHKFGLMPANGAGIMDADFCGDDDEFKFIVYNFTDEPVEIKKGTRIAQMLIMKVERAQIEEVERMGNQNRGGIGSTGH